LKPESGEPKDGMLQATGGVASRPRNLGTLFLLIFFLLLYTIMFIQARAWDMLLRDLVIGHFSPHLLSRFGALLGAPLSEGKQLYRLITAAFVHFNLIHLLFNSVCVFSLGRTIESYFGTMRMFISFVICSCIANALTIYYSLPSALYVGTLGGLFGLDGMILGFALRNYSVMPGRAFWRMVLSSLFWPVLWVLLALTVFKGKGGGIAGLISGFAAGTLCGLAFMAARLIKPDRRSVGVSVLFAAALSASIYSWVCLLCAPGYAVTPYGTPETSAALGLENYVCEEGGFEIPHPRDMQAAETGGQLRIGQERWDFCVVAWREAVPYDEPESLARKHSSDQFLGADAKNAHLVHHGPQQIAGEDGVIFVISLLKKGREFLYTEAVLIHDEKVYIIRFLYLAGDKVRQRQVDAMIAGFKFREQQ